MPTWALADRNGYRFFILQFLVSNGDEVFAIFGIQELKSGDRSAEPVTAVIAVMQVGVSFETNPCSR